MAEVVAPDAVQPLVTLVVVLVVARILVIMAEVVARILAVMGPSSN